MSEVPTNDDLLPRGRRRPAGWPEGINIVEVGPRDGLQSLGRVYPPDIRARMIRLLVEAGISDMEAASFMRPDMVPQMQDAERVIGLVREDGVQCHLRGLVSNRRGAERAAAAGVDALVGLVTCSDSYAIRNQNMTVAENLKALEDIAEVSRSFGIPMYVAMAIVMFCPYQGPVPVGDVLRVVKDVRALGVRRLTFASSVGVDGPREVYALASELLDRWPELELTYHLHNTNGLGAANLLAGFEAGVTGVETSICGLGGGIRMPRGMPYFGNFSTEDIVQMCQEMGVETGVTLDGILDASHEIEALLELEEPPASHAARGGTRRDVLALSASSHG